MINLSERLAEIKKLINEEIDRIRKLNYFPEELYDAAFHLITKGGKRLRPFIVLESTKIFTENFEGAIPVAVAIELLHNFTLIHDDIMDEDEMRRGVKTTHVIWGVPVAITAGDVIFAYLFKYVVEELTSKKVEKSKLVRVVQSLADGAVKVCEGQIMDLLASKYIKSENDYYEMVLKKTSTLFKISASLGGLMGNASSQQINHLESYGEKLGISFQIVDDILGLMGDPKVTGKPVGSDLREGKRTIIILHALRHASEEQKKIILNRLGKKEIQPNDVKIVVDLLKNLGSIDYARRKAKEYAEEAISSLKNLPMNEHRDILESLARFTYLREM